MYVKEKFVIDFKTQGYYHTYITYSPHREKGVAFSLICMGVLEHYDFFDNWANFEKYNIPPAVRLGMEITKYKSGIRGRLLGVFETGVNHSPPSLYVPKDV